MFIITFEILNCPAQYLFLKWSTKIHNLQNSSLLSQYSVVSWNKLYFIISSPKSSPKTASTQIHDMSCVLFWVLQNLQSLIIFQIQRITNKVWGIEHCQSSPSLTITPIAVLQIILDDYTVHLELFPAYRRHFIPTPPILILIKIRVHNCTGMILNNHLFFILDSGKASHFCLLVVSRWLCHPQIPSQQMKAIPSCTHASSPCPFSTLQTTYYTGPATLGVTLSSTDITRKIRHHIFLKRP